MKKVMLLGGSAQQVIAIETAKKLGYYTVLCDYLPDNPGQFAADKFFLVSTTDQEAVLEVAREERIDGIVAYASDPAAPTAAYVAEQMGLPTNPYMSVKTLCNKDMFRRFLLENGFNAPQAVGVKERDEAEAAKEKLRLPVIVKPVDSSGSKGITVIRQWDELEQAMDFAFSVSRSKRIIIEEFIEKKHPYLVGGDIFIVDGQVRLWGLMNCHRDANVNPLVPVGKSYPLMLEEKDEAAIHQTLQLMVDKLHIRSGAMNIEIVVDQAGRVWPIDIGPRNGGNMIPDLLGLIFGVDVVEMTIRSAMGEGIDAEIPQGKLYFATHNLHSSAAGTFDHVEYSPSIRPHILKERVYKKKTDPIEFFDNAAKAVGILFLQFDSGEEMMDMLGSINEHVKIVLEEG